MTTLGRYQIFDKLGTGSMGTVYRAQDTILEREVALKTIRTEGDVFPELRERFYREARACARLQHPSIVVVHDLGEIDQIAYIAMELLSGSDFRKLISQRVNIPLPIKLEAMAQVCDALSYAHRQGIVHRDIKPSNLFLIEGRLAKVLDFGIARMPSSHLTQEGEILGTPNYMAPEQILGKPTDSRSDLFSAAVVFFEFLAYAHPFQGESIPRRIVEEAPDSLEASQRNLPMLLERVFTRALAKEPERRYQTGDDFAADLRALAEALLQNASPSFSRVQLPSDRDVTGPPAPPAEDPYEQRLSDLMQLIPEFEDALSHGDTGLARQILERLEGIGTADSRCAEPVRLCRARLTELESRSRAGVAGGPPTDPGTTPKPCPYCGAPNRSAAVYCIACGVRLPAAAAAAPAPPPVENLAQTALYPLSVPQSVPPPQPPRVTPMAEGTSGGTGAAVAKAPEVKPEVKVKVRPPAQKRVAWSEQLLTLVRQHKQIVWLAAGLLVALLLMILVAVALQPIPTERSVAAALVAPGRAFIYAARDSKSKPITVFHGERINLLELPKKSDQPWIRVQLVREKKPIRPGYMHVVDLEKWDAGTAPAKLALIRLFQPGEQGTEEEIAAELADLQRFVERFKGKAESFEAYVLMGRLELLLARRMKEKVPPDADWQKHVEAARNYCAAASGEARRASDVLDCQNQIAALTPVTQPEPPPPPHLTPQQIAALNKKKIDGLVSKATKTLFDDPDSAEKDVKQVLKLDPQNKDAEALVDKIKGRKDYLEKFKKLK